MLLQPGSKDGAIKVIRENGAGVAYSWSVARCGSFTTSLKFLDIETSLGQPGMLA